MWSKDRNLFYMNMTLYSLTYQSPYVGLCWSETWYYPDEHRKRGVTVCVLKESWICFADRNVSIFLYSSTPVYGAGSSEFYSYQSDWKIWKLGGLKNACYTSMFVHEELNWLTKMQNKRLHIWFLFQKALCVVDSLDCGSLRHTPNKGDVRRQSKYNIINY